MKKIISICIIIALLLSTIVCVQAASGKVWFQSDSSFQVGGTATVDRYATAMSVLQSDNVTSDMYNAALEFNMKFSWICSNGFDLQGQSVTWSAADEGREYICRVGFYSDSECTQLVDYIDSDPFVITASQSLRITTNDLHSPVLGEEYYVKITSTDPNAVYSEFMGSELSSFGLQLHSNGVIDGTPTKTGNCHINIKAVGPTGEDSYSTDVTVIEPFEPSLEVLDYPTQTTYMQGDTFNPAGMKVKITTFDGSIIISENGQYLDYYKEPLNNVGDVKIKLSNGDLFTFVYITVVPGSGAGGSGDMPPSITVDSLPTAYVGEEYYVRIDCGDLDAEFWEYYNPGKPNDLSKTGLTIMENGVLSGTPTKAGSYTFTICAGNDNGEDYATYTLVVKKRAENTPPVTKPTEDTRPEESTGDITEPTEDITEQLTEQPTDPTGDAAEATKPGKDKTDKEETKENVSTDGAIQNGDENSNDDSGSTWVIVGIVLGVVLIGSAILVILLLKRKKAQKDNA